MANDLCEDTAHVHESSVTVHVYLTGLDEILDAARRARGGGYFMVTSDLNGFIPSKSSERMLR